ncbi:MAG: MFS transporter [Phycisphaeraceae bacterium]|nr:MFS transporter [Phycisphaeraceae bacterium]
MPPWYSAAMGGAASKVRDRLGSLVRTGLWTNPSFQLMWLSVAASGFGDRILQQGAMEMLGFREGDAQRASVQASVMFFFFVPYLVFGPIGGWLADTLPRKWIMLTCDELRGVVLLICAVLIAPVAGGALSSDEHWQVYLMLLGIGVCAGVFAPTRNAIVPQIVPRQNLQSANAIILGITTIAGLIGVVAAGEILDRGSVRTGLYTAMLLFMISGSFFAFLKVRHGAREKFGTPFDQFRRIVQGLRFIRSHRRIAEMVGLYILFWLAAMIFLSSIAAFARSHYQIDPEVIFTRTTRMQALIGFGMLTGAVFMAWQNSRRESAWVAMLGILGSGLTLILFAFNTNYTFGMVLCFLCGFFGNLALVIASTLTQNLSANYIRGRVFGAREVLSTSGVVAVNLVIWQLPDADGWMMPALLTMAALMIGYAVIGLSRSLFVAPVVSAKHPMLAKVGWRINRFYVFSYHHAIHHHKHNLPMTGPAIVAANHTTGIDGLLIQAATPRIIRWLILDRYVVGLLRPIWRIIRPIPVDPDRPGTRPIRDLLAALKEGEMVGIFPEGQLQRDQRDLKPLRQGVAMLARRSGAPVIPTWISGTPRARSMWLHFLLPSNSVVVFGDPLYCDPDQDDETFIQLLHDRMMELQEWTASQLDADPPRTAGSDRSD